MEFLKRTEYLQQLHDAQKKRIERVVFSGGGAKGVIYPGSYKAMQDTGILRDVNAFAGSSAGGIVAVFAALGISSSFLREALLTTNLKDLMGNRVGAIFGGNEAGITFLTKDGKPLEEFLRKNVVVSLRESFKFLKDLDVVVESDPKLGKLIDKIKDENPTITFGDLALLNSYFPYQFKQFTTLATQFPGGEVQVFNADLTPDVEIALACRASCSIPIILKPVEIEINGVVKKFMDGGVYDNLPTDYFDGQKNGAFIKNRKPEQTLVFAFGEGLDNKKNNVFQALYGKRWDEVVTDEAISTILQKALELTKKIISDEEECISSPKDEARLLNKAVKKVLKVLVDNKDMSHSESEKIRTAMDNAINRVLHHPEKNKKFWSAYKEEKSEIARIKLLISIIKRKMKPVLYYVDLFERIKRGIFESFSDFNANYSSSDQKEKGYQKIRSEYALRTVELRVGTIRTTDFSKATKVARVMDSLGYLDTVNHVTNHDLHNLEMFDADKFFHNLVNQFEVIHTATLLGSGKEPRRDFLVKDINLLKQQLQQRGKSEGVISREIYHLIKERVEKQLNSVEAFALTRAVEFNSKQLSADDLFKEIYKEGFKRSGFFSKSNITGSQIFTNATLHESLKCKSMFKLYEQRHREGTRSEGTRTAKIFNALNEMAEFHDEYPMTLKEGKDSVRFNEPSYLFSN